MTCYTGPERRKGTYGAEIWALRLVCTILFGMVLLFGLLGSELTDSIGERLNRISQRVDAHMADACCPCPLKERTDGK